MLDARYITQSDNTAVSSWADRSGNAYNANQATGANQPTFRTSQQGGCGGVDFDGSNDFLTGTYNPTEFPRTVHAVIEGDGGVYGDANYSGIFFQVPIRPINTSNPEGKGWIARWGTYLGTTFVSGDTVGNITLSSAQTNVLDPIIGSWSSDSSRNVTFFRDGSSTTIVGNPTGTIGTPTTSGFMLGRYTNWNNNSGENWNGRIFSLHVWGGEQIAAPIRKRCEHASAFAYKIACN